MTLRAGHIARHAPTKGPGGREAAVIDVAQDILHLTALKCWVDVNGLRTTPVTWLTVDRAVPFDAPTWLAPNRRIDDESIGLLMNPPPDLAQLREEVSARYGFLADIPADVSDATTQDRRGLNDIIKLLKDLPGGRFDDSVIVF